MMHDGYDNDFCLLFAVCYLLFAPKVGQRVKEEESSSLELGRGGIVRNSGKEKRYVCMYAYMQIVCG